jgi:1,5-anhydro-D-fructose reductase (1,5-anhydro-D-mannitol-forming)
MDVIRWGILGCGDVTEVKSGPGFQKAAGSALVAVMRRDGAKAADYAKRHGVARWYDDAEALIHDKEVDAVYVATPPGTHEFYAMKVLAAGKPCYVEKPMSRNAAEARRMVEGFAAKGVPLFVAYYRRALPRFLKVKEVIDSGALGKVKVVTWFYKDSRGAEWHVPIPWRVLAEQSGGGLFLDMAAHALDLLDFWLGPLTVKHSKVENVGGGYDVEDSVTASFEWTEGTHGVIDCQFHGGADDQFFIGGEKGSLMVPCFGPGPVEVALKGKKKEIFDLPNPAHVAQPLIQTVVDELLGRGKCPSTGASGLRTQAVMDEILEDYYGGREDGFWRRTWPRGKPSVA